MLVACDAAVLVVDKTGGQRNNVKRWISFLCSCRVLLGMTLLVESLVRPLGENDIKIFCIVVEGKKACDGWEI
jgi:hypothetical protein